MMDAPVIEHEIIVLKLLERFAVAAVQVFAFAALLFDRSKCRSCVRRERWFACSQLVRPVHLAGPKRNSSVGCVPVIDARVMCVLVSVARRRR